jgi:PTS system nitrogen regulatory IIA component
MSQHQLLDRGRVVGNVDARSKKRALEILSGLLAESGAGTTAQEAFENLLQREKLGCTALGHGVAVPHGRAGGLDQPIGAFVKLQEPVDFDAPDAQPVDLIFALLMPDEVVADQQQTLERIARLLADPLLREQLRQAESSSALYELLQRIEDQPAS